MSMQLDLMRLPDHVKPRSKKRGHAAQPGGGPEGQQCRTCRHLRRLILSKTYLKCGLIETRWTGSEATDVRASDPACIKWESQ